MRIHRSLIVLLGLVCLAFTLPLRADEKGYSYARIVRLSLVSGDVQVTRSNSSGWENAMPNMPIEQGFTIGTNNGRAEIEFESAAAMWIAENSVVQFAELALSDGGRITRVSVAQGTASFEVKLNSGDVFEIITPTFHVSVPNHAKLRVDAFRDGASVSVFEGAASVKDGSNTQLITSGRTFANRGGEQEETKVAANPGKDSWDNWVNDRAGMMASGVAQTMQYTDSPVSYGMGDLASYGDWLDCPGYGFGWQPWGMGASWAPFYDGYFDYYNGLGWTWISFEPWGWAPYHFGNWAYDSGCGGWMWFPGAYGFWNPAPLIYVGTGGRGFGWHPRPVPWPNPRGAAEAIESKGKFPVTPIVLGEKGGIGNGFATGILASGKEDITVETAIPPGKNGKFVATEAASRTSVKPPLAVPTASSLAALRAGVSFDAANYRFVNAEAAAGAPEKLPVLANGVREPRGVPHQPAPSGFAFSRESVARMTAEARSGASSGMAHGTFSSGGGFSHGGEASHGGFGSSGSSGGSSHGGGSSSGGGGGHAH